MLKGRADEAPAFFFVLLPWGILLLARVQKPFLLFHRTEHERGNKKFFSRQRKMFLFPLCVFPLGVRRSNKDAEKGRRSLKRWGKGKAAASKGLEKKPFGGCAGAIIESYWRHSSFNTPFSSHRPFCPIFSVAVVVRLCRVILKEYFPLIFQTGGTLLGRNFSKIERT